MSDILNIPIVDLSDVLPPVVEAEIISVWYDSMTKEVYTYHFERDDGKPSSLEHLGLTNALIIRTPEATKYADPVYSKNYYDEKYQRILSKPTLVLSVAKSTALCDGTDLITVTVDCKTFDGKDYVWDEITLKSLAGKDAEGKDVPGIAQTSSETLTYDPSAVKQQFRVRSFLRGKTQVKAKYRWVADRSPTLTNGNPSFPLNYGVIDASFVNPGF